MAAMEHGPEDASARVVLFLAICGISTVETALHGHDPARAALYGYRNFLYLSVALTIALELADDHLPRLLDAAIALAALISIVSILAAASHSVAHLLLGLYPNAVYDPSRTNASSGLQLGNTPRVRLAGLFFAYSLLIPTVILAMTVKDRRRPLRIIALGLMLAAVALSLNRNMYTGLLVGSCVTAAAGTPVLRRRFFCGSGRSRPSRSR